MTRIMFVCHGNICRSPMAEFIFRKLTEEAHCTERFPAVSRATSTEEIGNPVYPPAKAELALHGISCAGKTACQVQRNDYDRYELFLCMDDMNVRNLLRIFGSDPQGKVKKLLDYTPRGGNVADPWYTDRFDVTYRDITEGCQMLLKSLLE